MIGNVLAYINNKDALKKIEHLRHSSEEKDRILYRYFST
jgi:hypothetical protein